MKKFDLNFKKPEMGVVLGALILAALLAFEVFNFTSTEFALGDFLGSLTFAGIRWATLLAFAFCAMDFAGIARIFTPEQGRNEPAEVWYLFGAWLLAAAFNASLTWWGIKSSMSQNMVLAQNTLMLKEPAMWDIVPIGVAVGVLVIRVLLINTFSLAGERIFTSRSKSASPATTSHSPVSRAAFVAPKSTYTAQHRPGSQAPKPTPAAASRPLYNEPTYHPVGMQSRDNGSGGSQR